MRNVFIVFISLLILKLALIAVDDVEDVPLLAIAFATRILRTWDLASQKILYLKYRIILIGIMT